MLLINRKKVAYLNIFRHIYGPHICGGDGIDIDPKNNHILTASWRQNDTLQVSFF